MIGLLVETMSTIYLFRIYLKNLAFIVSISEIPYKQRMKFAIWSIVYHFSVVLYCPLFLQCFTCRKDVIVQLHTKSKPIIYTQAVKEGCHVAECKKARVK